MVQSIVTLRCSGCGNQIGHLRRDSISQFYFSYRCKCGEQGYLDFPSMVKAQNESARMYHKDGKYVCQYCSTPLFLIDEKKLINFSFRVRCHCGCEYDNRF